MTQPLESQPQILTYAAIERRAGAELPLAAWLAAAVMGLTISSGIRQIPDFIRAMEWLRQQAMPWKTDWHLSAAIESFAASTSGVLGYILFIAILISLVHGRIFVLLIAGSAMLLAIAQTIIAARNLTHDFPFITGDLEALAYDAQGWAALAASITLPILICTMAIMDRRLRQVGAPDSIPKSIWIFAAAASAIEIPRGLYKLMTLGSHNGFTMPDPWQSLADVSDAAACIGGTLLLLIILLHGVTRKTPSRTPATVAAFIVALHVSHMFASCISLGTWAVIHESDEFVSVRDSGILIFIVFVLLRRFTPRNAVAADENAVP